MQYINLLYVYPVVQGNLYSLTLGNLCRDFSGFYANTCSIIEEEKVGEIGLNHSTKLGSIRFVCGRLVTCRDYTYL